MLNLNNSEITNDDYEFIEKVIDAYLLVKTETMNEDCIVRHDFLTLVIDKIKTI